MSAVDLIAWVHIQARAKVIGAQVQIVSGTTSLLFVNRDGAREMVADATRLEELLCPPMVMPIEPARTDSALDLTADGHALRVADALIDKAKRAG